jgi:hypothetical protein
MEKFNPESFMAETLTRGTGDAIIASESRGQQQLVNSTLLPTQGTEDPARWETMGIALGAVLPGDPLFREAKLPPGWSKQPTEHSMWSDLVDDRGRVRAHIFYKAAFYDRRADIRLAGRFQIEMAPAVGDNWDGPLCYRVLDGKHEIYRSGSFERPSDSADRSDWVEYGLEVDRARDSGGEWLAEHGYPDWQNPLAYWDDEEETA